MLKSVQGIFRDGRVELIEPSPQVEGRVIVTFLAEAESVDLAERGIDRQQASDLRRRLAEVRQLRRTWCWQRVASTSPGKRWVEKRPTGELRLASFAEDWQRVEMDVYDAP